MISVPQIPGLILAHNYQEAPRHDWLPVVSSLSLPHRQPPAGGNVAGYKLPNKATELQVQLEYNKTITEYQI